MKWAMLRGAPPSPRRYISSSLQIRPLFLASTRTSGLGTLWLSRHRRHLLRLRSQEPSIPSPWALFVGNAQRPGGLFTSLHLTPWSQYLSRNFASFSGARDAAHPILTYACVPLKSIFGSLRRTRVLIALLVRGALTRLEPPPPPLRLHLRSPSSCGAQQGSPIAAACFAVVTRDIFMAADSHLCSVESPLGAARFSHDDGFLCSPDPGRVHTSFATLCSALHSINLEVQVAKCKAVFPPGVDPPAGIPSCPGLILHGIPAMTCRRRLRHPSPLPCSKVSSWRLRSRVVLAYWLSGRMRRKLEYIKMNHFQPLQSTSPVMHEVPFQLLACVQ